MVFPTKPRPFYCWPIYSDPFENETPPVWYGGGWRTGLPVTNVGTEALDQFARSIDLDYSNTLLKCNLQRPCDIAAVEIPFGNYSRSAKARVSIANSDGALTSAPLHVSALTRICSLYTPDRVPRSFKSPFIYFVRIGGELATVRGSRVMIEIQDPTNTAGYLQINRAMVTGLLLGNGIRVGANDTPIDNNEYVRMDGGNVILQRRPPQRSRKYAHGLLEEAETFGELYRMEDELVATGAAIFQGWDIDDPLMFDRGYLARLTPSGSVWEHAMYQRREFQWTEQL